MMKEAQRQHRKRVKHLATLAVTDPAAFALAWNKRLGSWAEEIQRLAGVLRDHNGVAPPAVFELVNRALIVLKEVGEEEYQTHGRKTKDFLTHVALKAFAMNTGNPQLYRLRPVGS
jgi:hypothetical protein